MLNASECLRPTTPEMVSSKTSTHMYRLASEALPTFSALTPREQDVMLCIAKGMPNKIIGDTLGISQRTVEAHRARIFRKLNIRNAVELVNYVWLKCHPTVASALVSD